MTTVQLPGIGLGSKGGAAGKGKRAVDAVCPAAVTASAGAEQMVGGIIVVG